MSLHLTFTGDALKLPALLIRNSIRKTRDDHQFSSPRKFVLVCLGFLQWRGVRAV
jgi:hypothetical protein